MPYHGMRFISREKKVKHGQQKQSLKREREREKQGKKKVKSTGRGPEIPTYLRERSRLRASERARDRQSNLKTSIAENRSLQ